MCLYKLKSKIRTLFSVIRYSFNDLKYNYNHAKNHSKNTLDIQYSTLRMYCHMLDKGMNNVHFEKGHSHQVYIKAKKLQEKLSLEYGNEREFEWINKIIKNHEKAQINGKPELTTRGIELYNEQQIFEYTHFITNRTSCRNFLSKYIPHNILNKIIKIAIDAPNSCCRQSVRYYITQDSNKIKLCIPHIAGITNFSNIQCLVCVSAESSYYGLIDKNLQYVDASLSAENFILGASMYGVYGSMCNFFHASKEDINICKLLFTVKETENIVMFIACGYPIAIPEKPERREVEFFYKEI